MFRDLSADALQRLSRAKQPRLLSRHDRLNRHGEPAQEVYCLCSGFAKVVWQGEETRESIVRLAGPGDALGYRCIFSEERFRASGVALQPASACKIDRKVLIEFVNEEPAFARELLRRMGGHIAEAENRHHSFVQRNVRERLAESLLNLKKLCGVREERGWRLEIRLTRNELSAWIGAAKETVVRCLSDFREEGLIGDSDDERVLLTILDLPGLEKTAALYPRA